MSAILTVRVARKEHRCSRCRHPITPGQQYVDQAWPPWSLILDDVDDDGRPVGGPSGVWDHERSHVYDGNCPVPESSDTTRSQFDRLKMSDEDLGQAIEDGITAYQLHAENPEYGGDPVTEVRDAIRHLQGS